MSSELARKLQLRPNHRVRLLNAPPGTLDRLLPLPEGAACAPTQGEVAPLFVQDLSRIKSNGGKLSRY